MASESTRTPGLRRPDGGSAKGVFLSTIANRNASIRPSTNTGTEMPMLAKPMTPTSAAELRRYAEMMPSGTPTTMANRRA